MNPIQKFQRFLRYETEATRRALLAIGSVPDVARTSAEFSRACAVMAHIQIARRVWLSRLGGTDPVTITDWFPLWDVTRTGAEAARLDELWRAYLSRISEADLDRRIDYRSSEGAPYTSLADDIITQVFNHSSYHRGQVARLVTEAGGERAVTDYIFLAREGLLD